MSRVIDQLAAQFAAGRLQQLNDGVVHLPEPTRAEAAGMLRHFADLVESGQIGAQRVTMAERGRKRATVYQAFTLWFASIEPSEARHDEPSDE